MNNNIHIQIPKHVITPGKHTSINFAAMRGKVIIGMMGYAKSGKDTITKTFIDDYGYQRVAFADNIKKEMNLYLKEEVCKDINQKNDIETNRLIASGRLVKRGMPYTVDQIDFFTENLDLKKVLRPYIIWYGEALRQINGVFCWINRAFEEDGKDMYKIVLSDVRRMAELDIFKNSNEFIRRTNRSMLEAGVTFDKIPANDYSTLLFEVSQYGLSDPDVLTTDTVRTAHEQWLVDDVFYVDSRIPAEGDYRKRAIDFQIKKVVKKFGIEKVKKSKNTQLNIYQDGAGD